ncbi:MAG: phosphoglycolate phosphatase [Paracoccaceae bacterium]
MTDLRLVIFDVDGTLVDSQADIIAAMNATFSAEGLPPPAPAATIAIVGLSLEVAIARLHPSLPDAQLDRMVQGYKDAYIALRGSSPVEQTSPLYPQAREVLLALHAQPETLLAVATGKSRRGLDKLLEGHGLDRMFVSQQVSDHHPSKPHPAMILAALSETGIDAGRAVMIGDTTYDMDMARAAGVKSIGVTWGYHPAKTLRADALIDCFADLPAALDALVEP